MSADPLHTFGENRRRLLRWYRRNRRDLPWRRNRDPYAIWVSEIMLQQTRVDVVVPYFERFIERFPNVRALARAQLDDVLHAWSGLGYYRRARHLHAAANQIVVQHAGRMPTEADRVRALPGIGRYTAGAICSIAFGQPEPILDGNVVRVFARWFGIDGELETTAVRARMWDAARRWSRSRVPGDANQALMELGATLCTKAAPACERCPVRRTCVAFASHRTSEIPRARKRPLTDTVHLRAFLVRRRGQLLLVRRTGGELLQGWWEVPTQRRAAVRRGPAGAPRRKASNHDVGTRLGLSLRAATPIATTRHAILAHRIEVEIVRAQAVGRGARRVRGASPHGATPAAGRHTVSASHRTALANVELAELEVHWVRPETCRQLPLSTLSRKALRAAAEVDSAWAEYLNQDVSENTTHQRRREPTKENAEQGVRVDGANTLR